MESHNHILTSVQSKCESGPFRRLLECMKMKTERAVEEILNKSYLTYLASGAQVIKRSSGGSVWSPYRAYHRVF